MTSSIPAADRGSRGYSLVEIMIALALGLLVAIGALIVLASTRRANATQAAIARVEQNGRLAIDQIAADLRAVGRLPCGAQPLPKIFAGDFAAHVNGHPESAAAPDQASNEPFVFDRSIFLEGHSCDAARCFPVATDLPKIGTNAGDQIGGTDAVTLRFIDTTVPLKVRMNCHDNKLSSVASDAIRSSSDLLLSADCATPQIFAVNIDGGEAIPRDEHFGTPQCVAAEKSTDIYDFDRAFVTVSYFLQRSGAAENDVSTSLIRRENGVNRSVATGIERLNFRYSLTDANGAAHWLDANQFSHGITANGLPLTCGPSTSTRACKWSDVSAVDVSMLVNSEQELREDSNDQLSYRYSADGNSNQSPKETMPVTGLPARHFLRREFHTVVALRNLAS